MKLSSRPLVDLQKRGVEQALYLSTALAAPATHKILRSISTLKAIRTDKYSKIHMRQSFQHSKLHQHHTSIRSGIPSSSSLSVLLYAVLTLWSLAQADSSEIDLEMETGELEVLSTATPGRSAGRCWSTSSSAVPANGMHWYLNTM